MGIREVGGESLIVGGCERDDVDAGVGAGRDGFGNVAGLVTRGREIEACPYCTGDVISCGGESGICCRAVAPMGIRD